MAETGVVNVVDPLGGSWYVEALTDKIEAEAERIFQRIIAMGGGEDARHGIGPVTSGLLRGVEDGWFSAEIAESAFQYQTSVEKGDKLVVGVNTHTATVTGELQILRVSHEVELEQRRVLAERRAARDRQPWEQAMSRLVAAARSSDAEMIEPILAACRAEATLGEICDALRAEWGEYTEPARF
jgi:methylmalonyl-CoA mutase N-terminal domain/subunit